MTKNRTNDCEVFGCSSSKVLNPKLYFYPFPDDEEMRQKWLTSCVWKENLRVSQSVVCALHFTTDVQTTAGKLGETAYPTTKLITSEDITGGVIHNLEEKIANAERELADIKKACVERKRLMDELRSARLSAPDEKELLRRVFSEAQIKILGGKTMAHWSNDDMMVGYTIRRMSSLRFYQHLTKSLGIPLPGLSSLTKWASIKNSKEK